VEPAVFVRGNIADGELVTKTCKGHRIDVVVHMAASSLVGQSVKEPAAYYTNNLVNGLALLDAIRAAGVERFVFSSTAAVYGEPSETPIMEDFPLQPTNPYGETKLAFERALACYEKAYGLRFASLRYFNAAGATEKNGEQHAPETHLIPLVLDVARGKLPHASIFGGDYPTEDGTCIRDYIHVRDLARAHVLAIGGMDHRPTRIYNLGCGGGYSVRQVIDVARKVTRKDIPTEIGARRAGDPAVLVADSARLKSELGWEPKSQELETIVTDAWHWLSAHPQGYPA
jgi:UDP-glucose 4-epimerase